MKRRFIEDFLLVLVAVAAVAIGCNKVEPKPVPTPTPTPVATDKSCTDQAGKVYPEGYQYSVGTGSSVTTFECRDGQFVAVD